MPVLTNPSWLAQKYNPATGEPIADAQFAGTHIPIRNIPDNYLHVISTPDTQNNVSNTFTLFVQTYNGYCTTVATNVNDVVLTAEDLDSVENIFVFLENDVPTGDTASTYAPLFVECLVSEYYFLEQALNQYVTCQQLEQFKAMYGNCVQTAYMTAVGKLTAQVGNIYDIQTMLGQTVESQKDATMMWVLLVMTAYSIYGNTTNISNPMEKEYNQVYNTIQQLKGGQVSLQEPADYRKDEYLATATVVSIANKYLG